MWIAQGHLQAEKDSVRDSHPRRTCHYLRPGRKYAIGREPWEPQIQRRAFDFRLKSSHVSKTGSWSVETSAYDPEAAYYSLTLHLHRPGTLISGDGTRIDCDSGTTHVIDSGTTLEFAKMKPPAKPYVVSFTYEPVNICFAALPRAKVSEYADLGKFVGFSFNVKKPRLNTTHYVTGAITLSFELLFAAVAGAQIVSFQWLEKLKEVCHLPDRPKVFPVKFQDESEENYSIRLANMNHDVGFDIHNWWGHSPLENDFFKNMPQPVLFIPPLDGVAKKAFGSAMSSKDWNVSHKTRRSRRSVFSHCVFFTDRHVPLLDDIITNTGAPNVHIIEPKDFDNEALNTRANFLLPVWYDAATTPATPFSRAVNNPDAPTISYTQLTYCICKSSSSLLGDPPKRPLPERDPIMSSPQKPRIVGASQNAATLSPRFSQEHKPATSRTGNSPTQASSQTQAVSARNSTEPPAEVEDLDDDPFDEILNAGNVQGDSRSNYRPDVSGTEEDPFDEILDAAQSQTPANDLKPSVQPTGPHDLEDDPFDEILDAAGDIHDEVEMRQADTQIPTSHVNTIPEVRSRPVSSEVTQSKRQKIDDRNPVPSRGAPDTEEPTTQEIKYTPESSAPSEYVPTGLEPFVYINPRQGVNPPGRDSKPIGRNESTLGRRTIEMEPKRGRGKGEKDAQFTREFNALNVQVADMDSDSEGEKRDFSEEPQIKYVFFDVDDAPQKPLKTAAGQVDKGMPNFKAWKGKQFVSGLYASATAETRASGPPAPPVESVGLIAAPLGTDGNPADDADLLSSQDETYHSAQMAQESVPSRHRLDRNITEFDLAPSKFDPNDEDFVFDGF